MMVLKTNSKIIFRFSRRPGEMKNQEVTRISHNTAEHQLVAFCPWMQHEQRASLGKSGQWPVSSSASDGRSGRRLVRLSEQLFFAQRSCVSLGRLCLGDAALADDAPYGDDWRLWSSGRFNRLQSGKEGSGSVLIECGNQLSLYE